MRVILLLVQLLATPVSLKYIYVPEPENWDGAYRHCRTHHTDLAPVNDQWDMDLLRGLAGQYSYFIWFGLLRNMSDFSKWWFSGGEEVTTFFWDQDQPNARQTQHFGIMKNYLWHDVESHYSFHFFCFSVKVVRELRTWHEALDFCHSQHTGLASVSSKTEMMLIQRELDAAASSPLIWIGLRFLSGQWLWVDGRPAGFQAWGPRGAPQCPPLRSSCAALVSKGWVWEARDCSEKLHFICH